jgi:hypothetical protein
MEPVTGATATATPELPLFPLNTVLFPDGPLPLRIFETRYTDMVRRCTRDGSVFGVVLIRRGAEAGEVTGIADVGTSARIVDFDTLPDGLLGLTCRGERKFRLLRAWRQADGLNVGEVEWLAPEPEVPLPEALRHLARILERLLPKLAELYGRIPPRLDDAAWVGARLAEILPLGLADRQACLELDDPLERLAVLAPLVREK